VQDVGSLYADRLAVVKVHARLQDNFDSTRISLFEPDTQIGAHIGPGATRLSATWANCDC
jgi:hypothetical protein